MPAKWLVKRGDRWHFRRAVPKDVQSEFPFREFKETLKRLGLREARNAAALLYAETEEKVAVARAKLRVAPVKAATQSRAHILYLIRDYFHHREKSWSSTPLKGKALNLAISIVEGDLGGVDQEAPGDLERLADQFLEWAKLTVEKHDPLYEEICVWVQSLWHETLERQRDRLYKEPEVRREPFFRDIDRDTRPKPPIPFAQAVEIFESSIEAQGASESTRKARQLRLKAWGELLPARDTIVDITRADVREAIALLAQAPARASIFYPKKTLRQAIELNKASQKHKPLDAVSVDNYLNTLKALFNFFSREGVIAKSPAEGLTGPKVGKSKRRSFTKGELNRLFSVEPHTKPWANDRRSALLFWMPLIALFTGARSAEIGFLRRQDIEQIDGFWFFNIRETDDRGVKTDAAERRVPIHPFLIEAGLLDYANGLKRGKMLFPEVEGPPAMSREAVSKRLMRHIRSVIPDPNAVFHSFRHSFRKAAKKGNVSVEDTLKIGGWEVGSGQSSMYGYGRDFDPEDLSASVQGISLQDLQLGHLKQKAGRD
ncbi:MAG: site-specific integrase [Proteobacteria bacterium]|nr:site-specific integrase [Pseudomonadota bacterium]